MAKKIKEIEEAPKKASKVTEKTVKTTDKKATKLKEVVEEPVLVKATPVAPAVKEAANLIEIKLKSLFNLQKIDSQIDNIRMVRGELPLEVQDLEDEIEGLNTRIGKLTEEVMYSTIQLTNVRMQLKNLKR
jgi:hypothetical protein